MIPFIILLTLHGPILTPVHPVGCNPAWDATCRVRTEQGCDPEMDATCMWQEDDQRDNSSHHRRRHSHARDDN